MANINLTKEQIYSLINMGTVTVWRFDDLWEEGYRFNDVVTGRYCFIPKEYAKNEHEAMEFLIAAYKFIPKIEGDSPLKVSDIVHGECAVIIDKYFFDTK